MRQFWAPLSADVIEAWPLGMYECLIMASRRSSSWLPRAMGDSVGLIRMLRTIRARRHAGLLTRILDWTYAQNSIKFLNDSMPPTNSSLKGEFAQPTECLFISRLLKNALNKVARLYPVKLSFIHRFPKIYTVIFKCIDWIFCKQLLYL